MFMMLAFSHHVPTVLWKSSFFSKLLFQVKTDGRVLLSCGKFEENNVTVTYIQDDIASDLPKSVTGLSLSGISYVFESIYHGAYSLSSSLTGYRTVCGTEKNNGRKVCQWELELSISNALSHTDGMQTEMYKLTCDFISSSMESFPGLRSMKSHQPNEKQIRKRSSINHPDFISGVSTICPSDAKGIAEISVFSDHLTADPVAICRGEKLHSFSQSGYGHWQIQAYFESNTLEECEFSRVSDNKTFVLSVTIPFVGRVKTGTEWTHVVSCVYTKLQSKETKSMIVPLIHSESVERIHSESVERDQHPGDNTTESQLVLYLTDTNKQRLNDTLKIGDEVRLVATFNDTDGETINIQVKSCYANSHPILENGCGTNDVFDSKEGFQTQGRMIFSPVFDLFRVRGIFVMNITCTFSSCADDCSGSSCRSRRSMREVPPVSYANGNSIQSQFAYVLVRFS